MASRAHYQIEPMSIADYHAVVHLWQNAEGIALDDTDSRPAIRRYLARNPALSFVAWSGHDLVGAVLCGHDGRRGYLHHLTVTPGHRRQGLGQKLVQACLDRLKQLGIHKCNIYLFSDNTEGAKFWIKNGWVERDGIRLLQKAIVPSELKRCC